MNGDTILNIIWFIVFFVLMFFYSKIMLSQLIMKLEQSAQRLEMLSVNARRMIVRKVGKKSKNLEGRIALFQDFFAIEPSSLDPFGIVKKLDNLVRMVETKFKDFVNEIAPEKSQVEKQEINYGLRAAIGVHHIAKTVRHYVETAKKFNNLQAAILLQMQLPIIERLAQAEFNGTKAFLNGWPVGDSIGPLVAASLIDKPKPISEGVVYGKTKILDRDVFVVKASGPGPELGRIDEAVKKLIRKYKISRVITIDAMGKLEGEKTGSVAFGSGFAMGGDVQKEIIENILLPKGISVDAIGVKVGTGEAIIPMKREIFNSLPRVMELVKYFIKKTKKNDKILIIGVGNSSGVGNNKKAVEEVKLAIKKIEKINKKQVANKKKKWGWF